MNQDIENYVNEFSTYLLNRDKSTNTIEKYKSAVRDLLIYTAKTPKNLTLTDLENYVNKARKEYNLHNKKTKFSGIKKYIRYLKVKHNNKVYDDYLEQKEITDEDIFKISEKPRIKPKDTLTIEEANKLINQAKSHPRNYAILKLFYHSWQRCSSILNLNLEDIDFIGEINKDDKKRYHKITIKGAKRNMSYDIYVDTEVIDAINRYLDVRENPVEGYLEDNYRRKLYHKDAVFLNGNGQRLKGRAINYMMKNYALESGVTKKKIHTHLWRSSGITIADSKNVSLGQIMARSGHTNIQSVTPYLNAKKDLTNRNISKALSCETENSTSPEINKSYSEILKQMRKLEKENKKLREELDRDYMTYG